MEYFTVLPEHLALIRRMNVEWCDDPYDGAPAVNIKRPYGNSDAWRDVAETLGYSPVKDDDGEEHWPAGTRDACLAKHREAGLALQVCVRAGLFECGDYIADDYRKNWRKV